jgi:hypothetical protein
MQVYTIGYGTSQVKLPQNSLQILNVSHCNQWGTNAK